jgi:hypothetical protein
MELFLNFIWILLFLPAWSMWRRNRRESSSARCFLILACALVLLFPVISATDDLHAVPQAMEESNSTKRSLRHADVSRAHVFSAPVMIAAAFAHPVLQDAWLCIPDTWFGPAKARNASAADNRAPPLPLLTHAS